MTDQIAQLRRYLNEIPDLYEEASHYLIPGSAPIDPTSVRGATIFRIPISPEIFDLLDERDKLDDIALNRSYAGFTYGRSSAGAEDFSINTGQRRVGVLLTLGMWVSLAWAELDDMGQKPRDCCRARNHTVSGEAGWLNEYAAPILELHPDFYRDIELLWQELRKACRIRREYVPTCPVCATATRRNRVEPVYGSEGDEYPAWWRCTACPKTWVHGAEVERLALTQPRLNLKQISAWLGLPLRTLHHWRRQNRITPDSRGLYEVAHVREAAKKLGREIEENAVSA